MAVAKHDSAAAQLGLLMVTAVTVCSGARAQEPTSNRLELGGVPAVNFDADEGFGYGVILELYSYGDDERLPYQWTVQPTVVLSTEGRRDFTAFLDAPGLLAQEWRLDVFVGSERHIATPYYGLGNQSVYDAALDEEAGPNPFYYRFGRTRRSIVFNLQRPILRSPLRFLFGGGIVGTTVDPVPDDAGTTLFAQDFGLGEDTQWSNYVRGGLIWDTRDRETGPRRGSWTELLVQWVDEGIGANLDFTRWTFTDRRYFPLGDRLVLAHRYLLQGVSAGAPAYELVRVQTSFKQQEGLGGSKTIRGVLKNRFAGRGMLVWNSELRWRVAEFRLFGRDAHMVLSAFLDQGRVWEQDLRVGELLTDLHRGYGGGVRVGLGENFIAALDAGTSAETGVPIYIGIGYLYE